jgi:hypothetical protein
MACDYWGYGVFTFTPWIYFREQYLMGMSASYGVDPVWWYLPASTEALGGPFGAAILVALAWFWARRTSHPVALPALCVVVGHTFMPHKELRYVFTALPAIPFALAYAIEAVSRRSGALGRRLLRGSALVYAGGSALALPLMTLRPASLPSYYYAYVDTHFYGGYDVLFDRREPMSLGPFDVYYYRPPVYSARKASLEELEARASEPAKFLFFHDDLALPESATLRGRCRVLVQTVPAWMQHPRLVAAFDPSVFWSLYECGGG